MKRRTDLVTRLERLEAKLEKRPLPRLIYALDHETEAGEPTGYMAGNVAFVRGSDETLAECTDRCFEASGAISIVAIYGHSPRHAPPERETADLRASPAPEPVREPTRLETAPEYGKPGVGTIAPWALRNPKPEW